MNTITAADEALVREKCRQLDGTDPEFAAWLKDYVKKYRRGNWVSKIFQLRWLRQHEFWSVPYDDISDGLVYTVLRNERSGYYLSYGYQGNGVLAIAPPPKPRPILDKLVWLYTKMFLAGMWLADPILRWGQKTCPQCFSRQMHPFRIASDDEKPSHYCNGCNTIWPPR